jgi:hypothetical protein
MGLLKLSQVNIRFLLLAFLAAPLPLHAGSSLYLQAAGDLPYRFTNNEPVTRHPIKAVPIQALPRADKIRINPAAIDLTLLGPPSGETHDLTDLRGEILAYIDVESLDPGMYVKPARIRLPSGYVLIQADPEVFVVEVFSDGNTASGKGR